MNNPFRNSTLAPEDSARDLLKQLTPEEKIAQLCGVIFPFGNFPVKLDGAGNLLPGESYKRDLKSFEVIMSRNNLRPETCLFVDDLARKIHTAQRLGMKTVHFVGQESIKEIYSAIGIGQQNAAPNVSPTGLLKKVQHD